jgi:hypothetical protein
VRGAEPHAEQRETEDASEAVPDGCHHRRGHACATAPRTVRRHEQEHPDAEDEAPRADREPAALGGLRLALNPEKRRDLFWNGAGRKPEVALSREERGTTHVEYLGTRIAFDGGLSPSLSKQRRLQQELGARIRASEALLREEPVAARVRALATVVERSLDPKDEVALDLAGEVFRLADDRRTLRELDHWLRGACARALSGRTGVRAFRSLSPRALREHGLPSFVARRDRARGGVGRGS